MVVLSEDVRRILKAPMGRVYKGFPLRLKRRRIISIGDVCTMGIVRAGVIPHLAVFDLRSMRKPLRGGERKGILSAFRKPKKYRNPAGTLSDRLLRDAGMLLDKGGSVLIDGEEDLTALAFILVAGKEDVIAYGQPDEGLVIVRPDEKLKKRIKGWLASSAALGHEV